MSYKLYKQLLCEPKSIEKIATFFLNYLKPPYYNTKIVYIKKVENTSAYECI
jgi:hypothetical protein